MMKVLAALAAWILSHGVTYGQKKDSVVKYFDAAYESCSRNEAVYKGFAIREGQEWHASAIDKKGHVLMHGIYKDKQLKIRNGWFTYYHPQGGRMMIANYKDNVAEDTWVSWYPNGRLKDSVTFKGGLREGPVRSYFENGQPWRIGFFTKNIADSNWIWYHENGKLATREKYVSGRLTELECFDTTGRYSGFNCSLEKEPSIKGLYGGIQKFIKDSLIYPKEAWNAGQEGFVEVQFLITRVGKMESLEILFSTNPLFTEEVKRMLLSVPGWYPAIEHNRTIDYTMRLKIPFYRNDD